MARIFDPAGNAVPVTVVKAGPCVVTNLRTSEKNGYEAVQLGFEETKKGKLTKPRLGDFEKSKLKPQRHLKELRGDNSLGLKVGQEVQVDIFKEGEKVDVTGTSIGKGFAGAMKRHNFSGGAASHGGMVHRRPCSAGATDAARTFKGKRSPGHMGAVTKTVQGLQVVRVDKERNLILIRGAVPGAKNGLLTIKETVKVAKRRRHKIKGTMVK
jgi:large subunit ribosomal protein L3